jgi:hypothetical protein
VKGIPDTKSPHWVSEGAKLDDFLQYSTSSDASAKQGAPALGLGLDFATGCSGGTEDGLGDASFP